MSNCKSYITIQLRNKQIPVLPVIYAIVFVHSIFAFDTSTVTIEESDQGTYEIDNTDGNNELVSAGIEFVADSIQKFAKAKTPYNPEKPLFREYKTLKNYRVNQSIVWGTRGLHYFAITGFFAAALINQFGNDFKPVIISAVTSGSVGLIGGIGIGLTIGNRLNRRDSTVNKANQLRPFINYRIAPLPQHDAVSIAGDIRFFNTKWYIPDILTVGYMPHRMKVDIIDSFRDDQLYYAKPFIGTYFNCTNKRLVNMYAGLLFGYARDKKGSNEIKTPFIDLSFMGEFNLFDFLLLSAEFMYEPYGVYQDSKKQYEISYRENFRIHISVGTFLL